jgi:hypothetical protein
MAQAIVPVVSGASLSLRGVLELENEKYSTCPTHCEATFAFSVLCSCRRVSRAGLMIGAKWIIQNMGAKARPGPALTAPRQCDRQARMVELRTIEKNIIEALGTDTLTLEQLAPRAGYEVNGHFKKAVSLLSKRGILGNKRPGHFVKPQYHPIISQLSA